MTHLLRHREHLAVAALLAVAGVLYFVNPGINGWANVYYSGAAQAGSMDWTAFLYGSSDPGNTITVDKAPAALWPIALSIRLFGLSAASIALPQALIGIATVGVLYATVRRGFPAPTALLAGGIVAVMPVATLMFRYDNPDALLVLLLTLATYFVVRGIEAPKIRWMLLAGAAVGLGFLTKELQAFLVLPGLIAGYLVAAPIGIGRRVTHLAVALGALLVSAGWWVALVQLVPASARPFVGGSQSNSFLEVVLGYNGIGRITGSGYGNGFSSSGSARLDRLLSGHIAGEIGWLLPAAIVLLVLAFALIGRVARTSVEFALLLVFGGSLVVGTLAFSLMSGIFHSYYTVALAPPIGAVIAMGTTILWRQRTKLGVRLAQAAVVVGSAGWAFAILSRYPYLLGLEWVVLGLGVVGAIAMAFPPGRRVVTVIAVLAAVGALLAGPLSYSIETTTVAHSGSGPIAGPASGKSTNATPSSVVVGALAADGGSYTWIAAAVGSSRAAELQLASGFPVMPLGGYKHVDPAPTLAQFRALVERKAIHWFLFPSTGGASESARISQWVRANFAPHRFGRVIAYDLTAVPDPANAQLDIPGGSAVL